MNDICIIKSSSGNQLAPLSAYLYSKRVVFLDTEINNESAISILKQLLYLISEDKETPIYLIIDSPGGEISAGLLIYDFIQSCPCPIEMYALHAYSMAGILFLSGKKRYVFENSTIMLHEPLIGKHPGGSTTQIKELSDKLYEKAESLCEIISKHTGKSIKEIRKLLKNDGKYFTAKEAVEWGIADEIVGMDKLAISN